MQFGDVNPIKLDWQRQYSAEFKSPVLSRIMRAGIIWESNILLASGILDPKYMHIVLLNWNEVYN